MTKSTGVGRGGARPGSGKKRKARTARIAAGDPTAIVKAMVDDVQELAKSHTALAVTVLAAIARDGEKEAARVAAANALLDRAHGKPMVATAAPEGKKAQRQGQAEKASTGGRFGVPSGPKMVVDNTR